MAPVLGVFLPKILFKADLAWMEDRGVPTGGGISSCFIFSLEDPRFPSCRRESHEAPEGDVWDWCLSCGSVVRMGAVSWLLAPFTAALSPGGVSVMSVCRACRTHTAPSASPALLSAHIQC